MKEGIDLTDIPEITSAKGGRRGAVIRGGRKTLISIRVDNDILEWFKNKAEIAGGGSYQAMLNEALKGHIRNAEKPPENLRLVIRDELARVIPVRKVAHASRRHAVAGIRA